MTTLPDAKLFIDGKLCDATGGATFDVISPWERRFLLLHV